MNDLVLIEPAGLVPVTAGVGTVVAQVREEQGIGRDVEATLGDPDGPTGDVLYGVLPGQRRISRMIDPILAQLQEAARQRDAGARRRFSADDLDVGAGERADCARSLGHLHQPEGRS